VSAKKDTTPKILGPDGKPYVAPTKKPEVKAETPKADGGRVIPSTIYGIDLGYGHDWTVSWMSRFITDELLKSSAAPKDFRAITAEQFDACAADFDGKGGEELPAPPRDLTTYRDAYASARSNCKHIDAVELLYQRQWSCDDCGRILNRDDMRRAGYGRGYFS
jgi:hypothetical protein